MDILDFFSGQLSGPVGNNMRNDPQDVRKAKRNLKNAGYIRDGSQEMEGPFVTRKMDGGIKRFQHDNNLKVDGIVYPGGGTERSLFEVLTNHSAEDVFGKSSYGGGSIGFGGNVSGTLVSDHEQTKPRSASIFSIIPLEKTEQASNSRYALSLNDESSTATSMKEQGEPKESLEGNSVKYDATGRMIRDNTPPVPERKPTLTLEQRKESILKDKNAEFKIVSNPDADGSKPWYAIDSYSEVKSNEKTIEREAKKAGVDPDMVKAIVHLETTQGWYDTPFELVGANKTIRPMNVHAEYWKDLGFSKEDLDNPEKNIQAGVKLLKSIQDKMPNASPAKIGTVYNSLGARKVSDYGARIEQILKDKPWKE